MALQFKHQEIKKKKKKGGEEKTARYNLNNWETNKHRLAYF